MPKYRVTVQRTKVENTVVEIESADCEAAYAQALIQCQDTAMEWATLPDAVGSLQVIGGEGVASP